MGETLTQASSQPGHFFIAGNIAALSDFSPLFFSSSQELFLNLKGITRINSIGVRTWADNLNRLQQQGKIIHYEECPEVFISSCNLFPELCRGVIIHSFYLVYSCEDCELFQTELLDTKGLNPAKIPPFACPSCKQTMTTEDSEPMHFMQWCSSRK